MAREMPFSAGFTALLVLVLIFHGTCSAEDNNGCVPSSCGNIHNISYPFWLIGRPQPQICGDSRYNLSCDENNRTVLKLFSENFYTGGINYGRYYVEEINYNNYTIRIVDSGMHKGNYPSIPTYFRSSPTSTYFRSGPCSTYASSSFSDPYTTYQRKSSTERDLDLSQSVLFMKCEKPVNSPLYLDTSPCTNKRYTYVKFGKTTYSEVEDSCQVEQIGLTSYRPGKDDPNNSCEDTHNKLAYGFELSWLPAMCGNCTGYCYLNDTNHIDCYNYNNGATSHGFFETYLDILGSVDLIEFSKTVNPFDFPEQVNHIDYLMAVSLFYFFRGAILLIGPYLAAKIVFGTPCVVAFLIYKWRRRHLSMYDTVEEFLQNHNNLMPIRYSYPEIKKMAKGFKDKLGEGGFGSVFKGQLRSGRLVAIKMLGNSKANGQDFISEVATIGRIHHFNVVQLIGFCAEGAKRALVYDFMPNGSLEKFIFSREGSIPLSVEKLYKISLGVAHGIEYLHRGCEIQILHFDIKPHNILLDENFTPKVSDFGLAKLYPTNDSIVPLTAARGTIGYIAPELFYKNIGGVSYKADVYSFGMLLMEMANRRKNVNAFADHSSQVYFPSWVYDQFSEGNDIEIEDATDEEKKIAKKMILVALWCIQLKPNDRPSMNKVVEMLEAEIESLKMPGRPFLSSQKSAKDVEDDSNPSSSSIQSNESDSIRLISNTN